MTHIKYISISLILFFLFSCSASGPIYQEIDAKPNFATLYIYRMPKMKGSGTFPWIHINGEMKEPLKNGGYLSFYLNPGRNIIEAKGRKKLEWDVPDKLVEIAANSGEVYYLKLDYQQGFGVTDSNNDKSQRLWGGSLWVVNYGAGFEPVSPEIAKSEIIKLKDSARK